jgi:hypothetical protein
VLKFLVHLCNAISLQKNMPHKTLLSKYLSAALKDVSKRIRKKEPPNFTGKDFILARKILMLQIGTLLCFLHKDTIKALKSFQAFDNQFDALLEKTLTIHESGSEN